MVKYTDIDGQDIPCWSQTAGNKVANLPYDEIGVENIVRQGYILLPGLFNKHSQKKILESTGGNHNKWLSSQQHADDTVMLANNKEEVQSITQNPSLSILKGKLIINIISVSQYLANGKRILKSIIV